jgi:hypothetical protein
MPNEPTSDLAPILREAARPLGRGTVVVAISPQPGPGLRHEMGALRRRGLTVEAPSLFEATGRSRIGAPA